MADSNRKRKVSNGAAMLPGYYYTDPQILEREFETIFHKMWMCVGRAEDIPKAGDYFTRQIGRENIVVVRGEDDVLRSFSNVCRHRGARICEESQGCVKGSLQCPYHAWTYGLDGRLLGAPHMNEVEGFDKAEWSLVDVGCEAWDGHVFVNFDRKRRPLWEQLGSLPADFERFKMADLRRGGRHEYTVAANWKILVENYSECYHCPLIHPALNRVTHYLSGANDVKKSTYNGGYQVIGEEFCTLTVEGKKTRPHFKGLRQEDHDRVYYYTVYPNMLLSLHPDYMMTHVLVPLSPDRTFVTCDWHFDAQVMKKKGFTAQDAVEFWDMTNRQDWHVCELQQLGMGSRYFTPGPYANIEDLLYTFDQFVVEWLEGRPAPTRRAAGES
jgi:Rieske 2Fe-2S family protein